jgi:hypothetical protein
MPAMTVPQYSKGVRAALYLRVSTARQAEHDVSIPDQKRQGEAYCSARGYEIVETYVEPGASATNDRRPEFQRVIEAGTCKPAPFDIVVVHLFSRFFRDHFELEFYIRKLAKNGVKLVSITQEMGDDDVAVNAAGSGRIAAIGVANPDIANQAEPGAAHRKRKREAFKSPKDQRLYSKTMKGGPNTIEMSEAGA